MAAVMVMGWSTLNRGSLCYLVCSFHPSISPLSIVIKSNLNSYLFPGFLRIDSIQTERSRVPQIASTLFRSSEQSKKEIRTRAYLNQPFLIVYLSSLRHLRQEQHLNMFDFRFLFSSKVDKWLPRQKNAIPYRDNGVCVLFEWFYGRAFFLLKIRCLSLHYLQGISALKV